MADDFADTALLRDIGRGNVLRYPNGETRRYFDDGSYTTVGARVGELEQRGLVRVGGVVTDRAYRPTQRPRAIQLTRTGEAVVAAAARGAEAADEDAETVALFRQED